jgi:hypothetical protein
MLSTISAIISIFNGAWTALKNLFGGKSDAQKTENTQAVEVANKAGSLSATEARDTRAQTEKEIAANAAQTDADVAAVRDAGSLQDGSDAINRAITRSRTHADPDR